MEPHILVLSGLELQIDDTGAFRAGFTGLTGFVGVTGVNSPIATIQLYTVL